ncbi:hypothetical protein GGF50DRAFT_121207 [Schizophyllum commune]
MQNALNAQRHPAQERVYHTRGPPSVGPGPAFRRRRGIGGRFLSILLAFSQTRSFHSLLNSTLISVSIQSITCTTLPPSRHASTLFERASSIDTERMLASFCDLHNAAGLLVVSGVFGISPRGIDSLPDRGGGDSYRPEESARAMDSTTSTFHHEVIGGSSTLFSIASTAISPRPAITLARYVTTSKVLSTPQNTSLSPPSAISRAVAHGVAASPHCEREQAPPRLECCALHENDQLSQLPDALYNAEAPVAALCETGSHSCPALPQLQAAAHDDEVALSSSLKIIFADPSTAGGTGAGHSCDERGLVLAGETLDQDVDMAFEGVPLAAGKPPEARVGYLGEIIGEGGRGFAYLRITAIALVLPFANDAEDAGDVECEREGDGVSSVAGSPDESEPPETIFLEDRTAGGDRGAPSARYATRVGDPSPPPPSLDVEMPRPLELQIHVDPKPPVARASSLDEERKEGE